MTTWLVWMASGAESADRRAPTVLWQATVGTTTYRTGIVVDGGQVLVPSNGSDPHADPDGTDGLYVLDARTGAVLGRVRPPGDGELDVNGVAASADAWFVGTDQGAVHRIGRADRAVTWSVSTPGDVEGPPTLYDADGDGQLDVAVAIEGGPLWVLDGPTGELRFAIERRWHFAAPAAADVDGDGVAELFVSLRDGTLYSADGRTGQIRWTLTGDARRYAAPILADVDDDGDLDLIAPQWEEVIQIVDPATGALLGRRRVERAWWYGVGFYPDGDCVLAGTASKEPSRFDDAIFCLGPDGPRWRHDLLPTRVSASPVVGDVDGVRGAEVVIPTEDGDVLALRPDGTLAWTWRAGGPIEAPVTFADLDGDRFLDLLVASNDGTLTALETRGRGPAPIPYFRGDVRSQGVLRW